jgi:hypothetical protein
MYEAIVVNMQCTPSVCFRLNRDAIDETDTLVLEWHSSPFQNNGVNVPHNNSTQLYELDKEH